VNGNALLASSIERPLRVNSRAVLSLSWRQQPRDLAIGKIFPQWESGKGRNNPFSITCAMENLG
jgi:hypothetical protein